MVSPSPLFLYKKNLRFVKKIHVVHLFPVGTKIVWVQACTRLMWAVMEHSTVGVVRSSLVR